MNIFAVISPILSGIVIIVLVMKQTLIKINDNKIRDIGFEVGVYKEPTETGLKFNS